MPRSIEHVRLGSQQIGPDGLEVQPADVVAAYVLAAVTGALRRNPLRRDAGRLDHQLLLAATLERDKPERGRIDAVTTCRKQTVVLVNGGFHTLECRGDLVATFLLDGAFPGFIADHDV